MSTPSVAPLIRGASVAPDHRGFSFEGSSGAGRPHEENDRIGADEDNSERSGRTAAATISDLEEREW